MMARQSSSRNIITTTIIIITIGGIITCDRGWPRGGKNERSSPQRSDCES
jgi:hypothetical protein